jgi:hypothetical protein
MAVITLNQKIDVVNNFINSVKDKRNSYYVFVGKTSPWLNSDGGINDLAVIDANNSITQTQHDIYQNMNFAKRLTENDIIFMAKRNTWVAGKIYDRYDNNHPDLQNKSIYVITDTNDVYKCIHNGYSPKTTDGLPSTVKPTIKQTSGNFQTSDGYIWKYLFTCEASAYTNFATSNYIPVTPNNDVIANAIPGTIDNIVIKNDGENYQVYEEGYLRSFVDTFNVQLPIRSSTIDDFYTNSSIYLKAGFGAGQIRQIIAYGGLDRQAAVSPAFKYYENLKLKDIIGGVNFTIGKLVVQKIANIIFFYNQGSFNKGDEIYQSDKGGYGTILHANTTTFVTLNTSGIDWWKDYPFRNTNESAIKKSGKVKVDVTTDRYKILPVSGTAFTSEYLENEYIRVGDDENKNIRRIVSVTAEAISVNYPFEFAANVESANNYLVPSAATADSVTNHVTEGDIVYTNLDSAQLSFSNVQPETSMFTIGETLLVFDENGNPDYANGTLSFANTSSLILSDVQGEINAQRYVVGATSQTKAHVDSVDSYPNITVEPIYGQFLTGAPIEIRSQNGDPVGNATVISKYSSPDSLTEYIIGPTVNILGDGNGATAYVHVDLTSKNQSRGISSVIMINNGQNYTRANVTITANTIYGSGASVEAQISPINGHGSEPYLEMNAIYCGISKKIGTGAVENFVFPTYGSYRNVGIIKNPLIKDVMLHVANFDRCTLTCENIVGDSTFQVGEVLIQNSSKRAGVITSVEGDTSSATVELKSIDGPFIVNGEDENGDPADDSVEGFTSGATANVTAFSYNYFSSDVQTYSYDNTLGGSGYINQTFNETHEKIRLTNVVGSFAVGDPIFEPSANAYATITSIYTANETIDSSANYGQQVLQTARVALFSNNRPYQLYEYVTQDISFATGRIISCTDEVDINYVDSTNYIVGDILVNETTGANGIVVFANNDANYIKVASISQEGFDDYTRPFNDGDMINNLEMNKQTTINKLYTVLILDDINYLSGSQTTPFLGVFTISPDDAIRGNTTGAYGYAITENSIRLPEFVRDSGKVIYNETLAPFDRTTTSTEQIKLIIKF